MTETPDTTTDTELTPAEVLARVAAVSTSITSTGRVDIRTLRSLPSWYAVLFAQLAYRARAIPRAELDAIAREAAVLGGVKPAKPPKGRTPFTARNIVNQLGDLWEVPVDRRQATNDQADQFVAGMLADRLIPTEDELAQAISDPGSYSDRADGESVSRWGARAVLRLLRHKLAQN